MLTRVHKKPGFVTVRRHGPRTVNVGKYSSVPDIGAAPIDEPAAWFLGPRAENSEVLTTLTKDVLEHIGAYRRGYLPEDPIIITPEMQATSSYTTAVAEMSTSFKEVLGYFAERATPFFSLRYQAHMTGDNPMPALAGYFLGMLHNPNNVTIQASTTTTLLELLAMRDLCHMVGWSTENDDQAWSHITADGSIANNEAVWTAREVKFLPFAIVKALQKEPSLAGAKDVEVTLTSGTKKRLDQTTNWERFNIRRDEILALPGRMAAKLGKQPYEVWSVVVNYDVNAVGVWGMLDAFEGLGGAPTLFTPSTRHYSWPKAAAVNGFGTERDVTMMVDADGRMSIDELTKGLDTALSKKIPVLLVVAVNGSTEESAIDDLTKILAVREDYRKKGLEFDIHVDAAWGGYFMTVVRKDFGSVVTPADLENPFIEDTRKVPMSDYSIEQFKAVREVDSVTIDPHKSGYIQYTAGSILYRNKEVLNLVTFTGAYIGAATEPTVGMFGLEGSKAGATAASVFFAHRCIRPSERGYGRILTFALQNTRRLYTDLLFLSRPEDSFVCTPLPRIPAERSGASAAEQEKQLAFIKETIWGKTIEEIEANPEALALFRELGPDQNILDYGFNPRVDGKVNTDPEAYNQLMQGVYDAFHIHYDKEGLADNIHNYKLLLSYTIFKRHEYGDAFMDTFAKRLGLEGRPEELYCLRSVIMDPYALNLNSAFTQQLVDILRDKVNELARRTSRSASPSA
ncbi:pyridoxal-dependent decarboxylase [Chondromyces crocatus]|nr:pyridoxal-dependent decarboxylase [Chondromyces crocatus]